MAPGHRRPGPPLPVRQKPEIGLEDGGAPIRRDGNNDQRRHERKRHSAGSSGAAAGEGDAAERTAGTDQPRTKG